MKKFLENNLSMVIIAFLAIIYIFLPSINNSADSIGYAADIRNGDIFSPHHLLFNSLGFFFSEIFHTQKTLQVTCLINAFFAIGCLWWARKIFLVFTDEKTCAFVLLFLGSCFGFLRFATDGEAYIIPLFFSLWASFSLLENKSVFVISLLASIACLFHQIHVFWWIGLGWYVWSAYPSKRIKNLSIYLGTAFIVPIAYLLVFYLTTTDCSNPIQYVFHDYVKCNYVNVAPKGISFLLMPISFIRTFIQVHGYMYPLIKTNLWIIFFILIILFFAFKSIRSFKKGIVKKTDNIKLKYYASAHLLIFFLQLFFAFLSDANAEFMIMLPFALIIYLFAKYEVNINLIKYISISVFIWNFSFGVFPAHFLEINPNIAFKNYIIQNPNQVYLAKDRPTMENMISYFYPQHKVILLDIDKDKAKLDSIIINQKQAVFSDMWFNNDFISRGKILEKKQTQQMENKCSIICVDTLHYDLGALCISKITISKKNN